MTNGQKNAKIPKDKDPKQLTLAECEELIAQAPERGARRKKKAATSKKAASKKTAEKTTKKKAEASKKTKPAEQSSESA